MGDLSEVQKAKLKEQEAGAVGAPVVLKEAVIPKSSLVEIRGKDPKPTMEDMSTDPTTGVKTKKYLGMQGVANFQKDTRKWQKENLDTTTTGAQKSALAP
jgi:hypothetical protein